jgi:sarcosine oxidase subunit beta
VPMEVVSATIIRSHPVPPMLEQVLGVGNADTSGRQEFGGQVRMGGPHEVWDGAMGEENGLPRIDPPAGSVRNLLQRFIDIVPAAADVRIESIWSGLIDQTVDALPVIQAPSDPEGLVMAFGFSGHGFCLGPATGRILAALTMGREPGLPIEPFRLERFAGGSVAAAPLTLHG